MDSEVTKPKRGRKKKTDPKINEVEESDVREKRERLVACVLSGNSKQYLGKEYTEQQINEMDCTNVNTLLNRYESVLSAQMTNSFGQKRYKFIFKLSLQCARRWQPARTKYGFRKRSIPQHCSAKSHVRFVLWLWCFVSSCKRWYNYW